jgi:5'-nucleotidase
MTDLPRIIMTNDDGIDSPGLIRLAGELAAEFDVVVAAPSTNMSGAGTSIGRFDPETGVELNTVEMDGFNAHTIAGPPGLAVMAAALGAFGRRPDLVVSGINAGINTGHSVIHSGTVGAALTARTFGSKGLAISLAPSDPWHWETAVSVGVSAVRWMITNQGPPHVLNINVPAVPIEQVAGTKWAELDEFGYFQVATTDFTDKRLQFAIRTETTGADPDSDTALCADHYVTMTPLSSIEPAPFPDIEAARIWSL